MELTQISLTAEDFDQAFMASLRRYGFAALIHHPLDDDRIQRIYEAWRVFFGSGVASSYAMDPEAQDGYFSPCLLYTSPSPRDMRRSRMPSSA